MNAIQASSGCRNSLQATIAPAGPRLPAIRRRLSDGAEREQGRGRGRLADERQGLLEHRRQREAAQAVQDAEHGAHDDRVDQHRARAPAPRPASRPRPPRRRPSSSSTVTELNTITSRVMISSAGTPPASPYSQSSSGRASMTPLENAEPNAWMVISAIRMPNTSRADRGAGREHQRLRAEIAAEKAPLGDRVELGLGHQPEDVRRDREVEHERAEPADPRLAEKARPPGEKAEKDHREQRDDRVEDGDHALAARFGAGGDRLDVYTPSRASPSPAPTLRSLASLLASGRPSRSASSR